MLIDLLVAVPFAARDPPRLALGGNVEPGHLVGDAHCFQSGLFGQFIAKADTAIEQTKAHVHAARSVFGGLNEVHEQFGVPVMHEAALTPGLFPGLLPRCRFTSGNREPAHHVRSIGQ